MSFSCPDLSFENMLEVAARFGYDGVEIRIDTEHQHGLESHASGATRRDATARAESAGVMICCVATSCHFADPATAEQHVPDALSAIDLAADLGAATVRVFGGKIADGLARASAVEQVAGCLGRLADAAARRKVVVCVETHDDWCDAADVAAVMRHVDHPSIAVNWDIMHPVLVAGYTMAEAFETLCPWIRHVHVHDGRLADGGVLQLCPIGEGNVNHARALGLLAGMGYDGFISGEWIDWEPWEVHLPRELETLKALDCQRQGR